MSQVGLRVGELRVEGLREPLGVETAAPRLSWVLQSEARAARQTAYRVQVASDRGLLNAGKADLWDSGRVDSDHSAHVAYAGKPLESRTRCWWRVMTWDGEGAAGDWSAASFWEMGLLDESDWQARWIGRRNVLNNWIAPTLPAPILRKSFTCADPKQARAYICGLGFHELYINGRKVGDRVLEPTVTHYDKRIRYVTHDITGYLKAGQNAVAVILGNGWYNSFTTEVWHFDKAPWRDYPKLLLQMEITGSDGKRETVVSDPTWRLSESAIVFDGLRNGETYDARREKAGWNAAGFDDSQWHQAALVTPPGGRLEAQQAMPCRVVQTIAPIYHWEVRPGVWVYDLGQNIAGWAQIRASAPAGTEVTLRYTERLGQDRDIDPEKQNSFIKSGDFQTDRYIFKGDGEEVWEPRFTYHGFRYVQVTGMPGEPPLELIRGRVVQTDFESAGEFACSNDLLNKLQEATLWSYRGNFVGIPTDCPHREKNGWTGDAQLAAETGLMNFDSGPAYREWLKSFPDIQRPSGQLPGIVPSASWGFNWGNGPAWDSALLLIPWYIYVYTGDLGPAADNYEAMKRYVDYCSTMAVDGIAEFGLGDWCHVDKTRMIPAALTSTAYWYVDCRTLAKLAALLGHDGDAATYHARSEEVRARFNEKFRTGEGLYAKGEQTAQSCALYQGLVPAGEGDAAVRNLVKALDATEGHLDFGILGAKYLPRALADAGYADRVYDLFTQTDFPSWGHWIEQGATTLWEDFHGKSSRNHIMFGDISAWMYQYLAGIAPDQNAPGFRRIDIHPRPVGDLTWVRASHRSPYGLIRSEWKRTDAEFTLEVEIPAGTTAQVHLPVAPGQKVTESGVPVDRAPGIAAASPDGSMIDIGSGIYRFVVTKG